MKINHNVSARMANINLKKADTRVSDSLERLTSGYKINKAADDAAGMAITNKMRAQIRALDQSSRNAEDGQSIIETAEGGLNEIQSVLQRLRELSVEAANDTYTLDDRITIQSEVDEMMKEIDRISETTEFNGTPLLDGSASRTISSNNAEVNALGVSMKVEKGDYTINIDTMPSQATNTVNCPIPGPGSVIINDVTIEFAAGDTPASAREKVLSVCDAMGIDVAGTGTTLSLTSRATGSSQQIKVEYPGNPGTVTTAKGTDAEISIVTTGGSQFNASATYTADGSLVRIIDNNEFEIQLEIGEKATAGQVTFSVFDAGYMTIQIGANEGQTLDMDFPQVACVNLGLKDSQGVDKINCCTQFGATNAIAVIDEALQQVSNARSELGSYQNRLASTSESLDLTSQNITEAMSRISDTDMAEEITNYTQLDILSQAATSMLAQANNRPQQVMALLQG